MKLNAVASRERPGGQCKKKQEMVYNTIPDDPFRILAPKRATLFQLRD